MLGLAGRTTGRDEALRLLETNLKSGAALHKFKEMVALQGGVAEVLDDTAKLPRSGRQHAYRAARRGHVARVDAERIGRACLVLGAGRTRVEDPVDHAVGVSGLVKTGAGVEKGQPLAILHANDDRKLDQALELLEGAFQVSGDPVTAPALIVETMSDGA
jgi:pyrimidine-nucleoside phosphorylase